MKKLDMMIREFCGSCKYKCTPGRRKQCYEWFHNMVRLSDAEGSDRIFDDSEVQGLPTPRLTDD